MTFVLEAVGFSAATAATIGEVGSILGSVIGAFGQMQSGQSAQAAAEYNARIALNNANAAEVVGQQEAARIHDLNRRRRATAQNAYGASGAVLDIGSPVDVMADLAAQGALDEEIARWRGKVSATGFRNQATAQQFAGQQAADAGFMRAGTMLLGGFGRIAPSAAVDPWANIPGQAGWY